MIAMKHISFISQVNLNVLLQITLRGKVLSALITAVRLLSGVLALVSNQITLLAEGLPALRIFTHILLLVLVDAHQMLLKRYFLSKTFVTLITNELSVINVSFVKVAEQVLGFFLE
jgi:hypothetical protein